MSTPSAPYWGLLPPPKVARGNSIKRERGSNDLSIDTDMRGNRLSSQSQPHPSRQNRYSTQTDAPTISTQSPFASPIASEFRGDGLAPRPPSFPYGACDTAYNKDFSEKRRRRESRNREQYYEEPTSGPPPAAPDAPRPGPPLSYKLPYTSAPTSSNYQAPTRARSTKRSEGPISPSKGPPEEYYRSHQGGEYPSRGEDIGRRPSNGKAVVRNRGDEQVRDGQERRGSAVSQSRKGSVPETEAQRRREWAPDRSPLQRLELTLDSITKEEKRARAEEAELLAREAKAGRGGDRLNQNSVRFRNRPVAKAPESGTQPAPQSLPEAGLVRSLSKKQKDQLQRSGTVEKKPPIETDTSPTNRGFDYQPKQENPDTLKALEDKSVPQRGPSTRDRSNMPVRKAVAGVAGAAGLGRSTSNKLRKNPPGDPWHTRRIEAENQYHDVGQKRPSVSDRQPVAARPSRGVAVRSHPQLAIDKELPPVPQEPQLSRDDPIDRLYPDSDEEMDKKPLRRGTLSKIERLTGQKAPSQSPRTAPSGKEQRTELVTVNGIKYEVPPTGRENNSTQRDVREGPPGHRQHHHVLPDILHHRHEKIPGQGVYIPSRRLDEWKKGGVALLSGALLDLEINDQTEAEKDKAWWEAGHTGQRRRSSTKQRKAEAYDGEYDDTNGMEPELSNPEECEGCVSEQNNPELARSPQAIIRSGQLAGYDRKTMRKDGAAHFDSSRPPDVLSILSPPEYAEELLSQSPNILKPHSLTCPMRGIRIRPNIAPTRFKPPLFLKSGPLLRYCGLRRERLQSRSTRNPVKPEREIWRGSIMIVTQDSNSSYELAPTLRLFLQPTDLLPPPPAQLDGEDDELAPEYVDPIAGLPKIGRDGRTLYIRPVDHLEEAKDLSKEESDEGLFEMHRSPLDGAADKKPACQKSHYDGEKAGKYKEVRGFRLHAEHGVTFWRFNIEIELRDKQQRIAYRINRGPATGFWVPGRAQAMNIMFYSCNGFSRGVDSHLFSGPDPLWRDVLNTHQTQPFHVMLGGGDQLYNDVVMDETTAFKEWLDMKDPHHKEAVPFTPELQDELEAFYLNRYCSWFSQGLFGLATSQIPMINIFDDHDIIDGYGSYPDSYMRSAVMGGLGAVAFKYYMLFQHQSSIDEGEDTEPSWLLGTQPGPYITELSRSIFTHLGRSIAFLGLDCRTERMNDEIVSAETYHRVFDRLEKELIKGETKHLIVLLGIPVAYPRMVWLENM
jgi:hypothetical protein